MVSTYSSQMIWSHREIIALVWERRSYIFHASCRRGLGLSSVLMRQNSKLSKISIIARLRPLWRDEDAEMAPFYIYLFQKISSDQTIVTWLFKASPQSSIQSPHYRSISAQYTSDSFAYLLISTRSAQLSYSFHRFGHVRRESAKKISCHKMWPLPMKHEAFDFRLAGVLVPPSSMLLFIPCSATVDSRTT